MCVCVCVCVHHICMFKHTHTHTHTHKQARTSPVSVQISMQNKLVELRATYAALEDELTARMPLAYVQVCIFLIF